MTLNNIKQLRKDRGFTIVELLIVIIVIAILAAIVIVAYTGITAKANLSTAKENAAAVQKVAEAYNADENNGVYPTLAQLQGYSGYSRVPAGVTVTSAVLTSANQNGKTIQYIPLGTTGGCVGYWDGTANAAAYIYAGAAKTGNNTTPSCS